MHSAEALQCGLSPEILVNFFSRYYHFPRDHIIKWRAMRFSRGDFLRQWSQDIMRYLFRKSAKGVTKMQVTPEEED